MTWIPPAADRSTHWRGTFGDSLGMVPGAGPLHDVLADLYDNPVNGRIWTPRLLAFGTQMPLSVKDVERACRAQAQSVPWHLYVQILNALGADWEQHDICERSYDEMCAHLPAGPVLPPPFDTLITNALFMASFNDLYREAGLTLQALSTRMKKDGDENAWVDSTLQNFFPRNIAGARMPTNKRRVQVLLRVLCEQVGRPSEAEVHLAAWERLQPRPYRRTAHVVTPPTYQPDLNVPARPRRRRSSAAIATVAMVLLLVVFAAVLLLG